MPTSMCMATATAYLQSVVSSVRFNLGLEEPDRNPRVIIDWSWQRLQHPGTKEKSYALRSQCSQRSPEHPPPRHQGISRYWTYLCVPVATVQLEGFLSSCRSMSLCYVSLSGWHRQKDPVQCWLSTS